MIKRIWYGPEAEGFEIGKPTAFIEAEELTKEDLMLLAYNIIPNYFIPNNITRLYFGANEKDVLEISIQ